MTSNSAAWLTHDKAHPLVVNPAEYPSPKEDEVVIECGAVAINPADHLIQQLGTDLFPSLQYPYILGSDVAGKVVQVGSSIKRFKVGDRIAGLTSSPNGAFQEYTVLQENKALLIPENLSYEKAAVIPLGLSTAACGLFHEDLLKLQHPSVDPKPTGETILITGGSSSVGCNAIQLAVAAGYEVFTTASTKNFEYVKKLGASKVFDYNSETVIQDIIDAFKGKKSPGAFAVSPGSGELCFEVVEEVGGVKFVASSAFLPENIPSGINAKFLGTVAGTSGVGKIIRTIFQDFLPEAFAKGIFVAAPEPQIVGKGLSYIQDAFEAQKSVSAKKIVVSI